MPSETTASERCDVAIIGAGPGGSTCAGLLRKHHPALDVRVYERERFPREHVGESQLPPIGKVLEELGCWDEVERAGFPIKIGATYRWGRSDKLWDFEFIPPAVYREAPRPRRLEGQARFLAFQVDRAIYDDILARHAQQLGATVAFGTGVREVERDGDRVAGLRLADGRRVEARWYVDASGNAGILRRAMGVNVDAPTRLQNVAFWDYWENTEWATRFPGGATRVLVLSIGCGWIWFIPLGPTRTSIGFVCPAAFYKQGERSPAELYAWALAQEPLIAELTANATREGEVRATKDWSFVAERAAGENWLLVGEAAGFADPILAAGLTLTHMSAREAAYTLGAFADGTHDAAWLREHYTENQCTRIRQHIRFADFWYSANGVFTDLQEYTREIARDAGLDLTPQQAFQWLGTGGFTHDVLGQPMVGLFDIASMRQLAQRLVPLGENLWTLPKFNRFRLRLEGAERREIPAYVDGRVLRVACWYRGAARLPEFGVLGTVIAALRSADDLPTILRLLGGFKAEFTAVTSETDLLHAQVQALEFMLNEGWIEGRHDPTLPRLELSTPTEGRHIHTNAELNRRVAGE